MNTLIQISDCHIDNNPQSTGLNAHNNLTRIIDKITSISTDALLISGDLTHNGSLSSYQTLKQMLAPIQAQLFVIAGNHDNQANLKTIFGTQLFERFSLGNWEVISVDSVRPNQTSGYISQAALGKLDKLLQQSSAKYNLLVLHHPIVPMNSSWDDALSLENPEELFALLSKYPKIQAVLFGHAHQAAEFKQHNLKIISCPSTALQFDHKNKIGFNHYMLHDNGKLEYQTQWL